jgi:phosphate transport system ATP-binding protein
MSLPAIDAKGNGEGAVSAQGVDTLIACKIEELYYGQFKAVRDVDIKIKKGTITAFMGPSGCGKSTVLRCINRMNDIVPGFRLKGSVHLLGQDVYHPEVDPVTIRRRIGMVFQQPNPFAMSIYDNVLFGLRLNRYRGKVAEKVEQALRQAALWDEVKDKLKSSGLATIRRPAAATLYRARGGHAAIRPADGRALLRPGSHRHATDRGAHA